MHHHEFEKQKGNILTRTFFVLLSLVLIGAVIIIVRFAKGVGAVTNMSDGYPWGLWLAYDVAVGSALACGGYAMGFLIYIRNRMRYHPMIRSCLLTSMFGYALAGLSVMFDIGRPWNAYNFFVPSKWQINSVMFEVALCIMGYTVVLIIEFMPAVLFSLENSKWRRLREFADSLPPFLAPDKERMEVNIQRIRKTAGFVRPMLEKILIFFIALGLTLPTMHQSSLGALLLVAVTKLNPLWHTGFLPLLFLINCIYLGYAMVVFESIFSSHVYKRPFEIRELSGLGGILPWLTTIWLAITFGDLAYRNQLAAAFRFDFYSCVFLANVVLLAAGSLILVSAKNRQSPRLLFVSAVFVVLGGSLYRMCVYLIGFDPGPGWTYFPSLPEVMVSVSVVAFEILAYQVLIKLVPVLPRIGCHVEVTSDAPQPKQTATA
jgi:Ni/Fe-hydrogenase subunit HybB-like protein